LTLIDTAEEVSVRGVLPPERVAVPLELALATFWVREKPDAVELGQTRFAVRSPAGEELDFGAPVDVDLQTEPRVQTVGRIEVMPLLGAGRYEFVVQYRRQGDQEWGNCAQVPLDVGVSAAD
jgi:hypothetical protein